MVKILRGGGEVKIKKRNRILLWQNPVYAPVNMHKVMKKSCAFFTTFYLPSLGLGTNENSELQIYGWWFLVYFVCKNVEIDRWIEFRNINSCGK